METETEGSAGTAKLLTDKTRHACTAKAGQGGRLFGSVTAKEIAEEIKKQLTASTVDKRKIDIDADIKAFGSYT